MASSSNRSSPSRERKGSSSGGSRFKRTPPRGSGAVRIIGGQYRGRKLAIPDVLDLRPTPDRLRETLFNWLQSDISGSRCLDLFAGTGSLGWEAVSRYAGDVTFVEPNSVAYSALQQTISMMNVDNVSIHQITAEAFLGSNTEAYDIVFVDPPFRLDCQWTVLEDLSHGHLSANACVYVESPSKQPTPSNWPASMLLHREKRFGDVTARLFHLQR